MENIDPLLGQGLQPIDKCPGFEPWLLLILTLLFSIY